MDKSLNVYQIIYEEANQQPMEQQVGQQIFGGGEEHYSSVFVAAPDSRTAVYKVLEEENDIPESFAVERLEGAFYVTNGDETIEMSRGPLLDRHEDFKDKIEDEDSEDGGFDYIQND